MGTNPHSQNIRGDIRIRRQFVFIGPGWDIHRVVFPSSSQIVGVLKVLQIIVDRNGNILIQSLIGNPFNEKWSIVVVIRRI